MKATMKRTAVWLTGMAAALAAVFAFFVVTAQSEDGDAAGTSSIETASLTPLTVPGELPEPRFTRTMYAAVKLAQSDPVLDVCRGPVAVDVGENRPVLVAEHDYCGGAAWIPKLKMSDAVELDGDGIDPGIYVVTEIDHQRRHHARVSDLPVADVVLQTCISEEEMVLIGLRHLDPSVVTSA